MKSTKKLSSTEIQRKHSALAALASVHAEGLTPTVATKKRLDQYVKGTLTADQLLRQTITDIKARTKQAVR
jgi:hypothetical protein